MAFGRPRGRIRTDPMKLKLKNGILYLALALIALGFFLPEVWQGRRGIREGEYEVYRDPAGRFVVDLPRGVALETRERAGDSASGASVSVVSHVSKPFHFRRRFPERDTAFTFGIVLTDLAGQKLPENLAGDEIAYRMLDGLPELTGLRISYRTRIPRAGRTVAHARGAVSRDGNRFEVAVEILVVDKKHLYVLMATGMPTLPQSCAAVERFFASFEMQ